MSMTNHEKEEMRTVLMVDETSQQANWPSFYDTFLRRDYLNLSLQSITLPPPDTALNMLVAEAIATGHTRKLAHWASTAPKSEPICVGPLDTLYQTSLNNGTLRKMIAAYAVLLSLSGVAGVYLRDILGMAALDPLSLEQAQKALENPASAHKRLFEGVARLVRTRQTHEAFHPKANQEVLALTDGIWSIVRTAIQRDRSPLTLQGGRVVCLTNLSGEEQLISVDWRAVLGTRNAVRDLFTGTRFNVHGPSLALQAYQIMWVTV